MNLYNRLYYNKKSIFPSWISTNPLAIYFVALVAVSIMYSAYSLPWYYMVTGSVGVITCFAYGRSLYQGTLINKVRREKTFEQRIFGIALVARLISMVLIYTIFMQNYGNAFGFEDADARFYDVLGGKFSEALKNNRFLAYWIECQKDTDVSDMGYAAYVGVVYLFTDGSVFILRLLKCIWSALTVVLIYRIAKRDFDDQTARLAAIFCALWPNFWYYCGTHLKEVEMVFLAVLFVEQADQMLRSRQFTMWKVAPVLLIGGVLFTFRTPLALVAYLSLIFSVVMTSSRVVSWGKRVTVGALSIMLIFVVAGNVVQEQTNTLLRQAQSDEQQSNMEWRSTRKHGNSFAKYAGKSVFAPLIFTIPFPSMVRPFDGQEQQQLLNGGNYVKNIISFFTILAMFMLFVSGKWRDYLLPLSFLLGYLVVLTMSTFAQSERFHQPAMPFEFMFAAYGLSIAVTKPKYKRWFTYWCAFMFVVCIFWNWFKMAGRGLS